MLDKKVALITGCNGMDAKTLASILLDKNYIVILTYRRNSYFQIEDIKKLFFNQIKLLNNGKENLDFELCDITDRKSIESCISNVIKKYGKIDELYLLAAMSHVSNSFTQPEYSILANGTSYYYFLETLKLYSKNTKTYGAMSSELAGNVPDGFIFNEETSWHPKSPYSIGKSIGGNWIRFYRESQDSQLFCCFGILFNHSNNFRTTDFFCRRVTNFAAKIALGKEKTLPLGNLNFYRDEHWSDFGCEMMWKMLQNDNPEDYVIATGTTHHGEEYLDLAFNYFNLNWKDYVVIDKSRFRPNEVVRLIGDSSKAQKELGWNPNRMPFSQHINIMCEYDYQLELGNNPQRTNVFELYT